jgi:beta-glucosidase
MIRMIPGVLCSVMFCVSLSMAAEPGAVYQFPFQNPAVPQEDRIDDLVGRMTLEEKIAELQHEAPGIERLGLPSYNWWNECLHGVARAGFATVFPQAIGLAATWDTDLMLRAATAISDEARAKHHEAISRGKRDIYQGLTFWSPNINIFRDPRWGRGMETYGEDPYLTGKMGVSFVKGLQGDNPEYLKLVATVKHFAVHSGPEPDRHTFDARIDGRDLRETYLPHFRMCFEEAKPYSVMCAYNRYMGEACCSSNALLAGILRQEWSFDGYVVSDCGAILDISKNHQIVPTPAEGAALALNRGTDLNCGRQYVHLKDAVDLGLVTEKKIDLSLKRLMRARFKLGMFDPDDMVPWAQIPYSVVGSEAHNKLALETARKSIVLLKNENNLLPLAKDLGTIAVIGPNANDVDVMLANYNGYPRRPVTPLQGILEAVSPRTKVIYAPGSGWDEKMPILETVPNSALFTSNGSDKQPGLKAEYFGNRDFEGAPVMTRVDPQIDFVWWEEAPAPQLDQDNFSVRWSGVIVAPETGEYSLGGYGFSEFKVLFDGKELGRYYGRHRPDWRMETVRMEAGKSYKIKVEFREHASDARMRLLWAVPGHNDEQDAVAAAKQADVVVMCMGLSPRLEGEEMRVQVEGFDGGDRMTIKLPAAQSRLIQKIQAVGKPVVLVLLNGSAIAVNWEEDNVPAIVEAWYPGEAGGQAIADVLFGDYNPAGRLPVTFYKSVDQLPAFDNYDMAGHTYRYFNGDPLYTFGYGLSYTKFEYTGLHVPSSVRAGEPVEVAVTVKNTGDRAGEEVVQCYVTDEDASTPRPIRSLQGFTRILLQPGESKSIRFTLTPRQLSMINESLQRVVEPGDFTIAVGGAQPGVDAATTGVVTGTLRVTGDITPVD